MRLVQPGIERSLLPRPRRTGKMGGIVKRAAATVLSVVALSALAWLLWGSAGDTRVTDLAGVYRIDPQSGIEVNEAIEAYDATEADPFSAWLAAVLVAGIREGSKTGELALNPDSSLTWTMGDWIVSGRWEVVEDQVLLFFKLEGRREWPNRGFGVPVRDGALQIELADKLLILRKQ